LADFNNFWHTTLKKLDANVCNFGHLALRLLLHYLVKCRSRSLIIDNNEFILGSACVSSENYWDHKIIERLLLCLYFKIVSRQTEMIHQQRVSRLSHAVKTYWTCCWQIVWYFTPLINSGVVAGEGMPPPKFFGCRKHVKKFSFCRKILVKKCKNGLENHHFKKTQRQNWNFKHYNFLCRKFVAVRRNSVENLESLLEKMQAPFPLIF